MDCQEGGHPHVHFDSLSDEELQFHQNNIMVRKGREEGSVQVQVGFLQVYHKYEVEFDVSKDCLPNSSILTQKETDQLSLHCRLLGIAEKPDSKVAIKVEILPKKPKLFKETIVLCCKSEPSNEVKLFLEARVLGKGKGTPMLKNGIRCVGIVPDPEESDAGSDWHGFA